VLALALTVSSCAAVYPELATRSRPVPAGRALDPPPPQDLHWIKFLSGRVPAKTRDGRNWDQVLGRLPDPYAKLFVNEKEILRTPSQQNTLEPTWPDARHGNFELTTADRVRVELWDANPIHDQPIGVRDIGPVTNDMRIAQRIQVELDGGAELTIAFEPAHAILGVGLWYELRTDTCFVTRLLEGSPAARAGVSRGDEVVRIGDTDVHKASADEVRSLFNAISTMGTPLVLKHVGGALANVTLREGPIYPRFEQFGSVD